MTSSQTFDIVVAMDTHRGIGLRGTIPWRLPGDLARFRSITAWPPGHNVVIMGRRTFESLPSQQPLQDRHNVVVSSTDVRHPGVQTARSLEAALELAGELGVGRVFVIGGSALYQEALRHPQARDVHLTRIHARFNCDTFFPEMERGVMDYQSALRWDDGISYTHETWRLR